MKYMVIILSFCMSFLLVVNCLNEKSNRTELSKNSTSSSFKELEQFDIERLITSTKSSGKKAPKRQSSQSHRGVEQIKNIYESLKGGNLVYGDKDINTVRYIPSVKSKTNKKLNFIFNLSMLSSTEKILKAELYINKKHIRHRLMLNLHYYLYPKNRNFNLNLNSTKNAASTIIDLAKYRNEKFKKHQNWHLFNLADSLVSYVATRNNRFKYSSLAKTNFKFKKVYFTYDQANQATKETTDQLENLILVMESNRNRRNDLNSDMFDPYLILYSNEEEPQMKNFFQTRIPTEMLEEKVAKINQEKSEDYLDNYEKQVDDHNLKSEDSFEIKHESAEIYHSNKDSSIRIFENRPVIDASLLKSKIQNSSSNIYYNYLPNLDDKAKISNQGIELIFKDLKEFGNKKVKRELSDDLNENETNLFLSWNEKNWKQDLNETELRKQRVKCQTQPITIDFDDMSFSDWIIEPKSFQSNYCSGSCKFPIDKKASYSNYATLQSILNTIDLSLRNNPPQLCCSPSKMDMLPIFYLDSNLVDYVVKYLPDMIVKECACR